MQQLILGTGTAIWWLAEPHLYTTKKFTAALNKLCEMTSIRPMFIEICSTVNRRAKKKAGRQTKGRQTKSLPLCTRLERF